MVSTIMLLKLLKYKKLHYKKLRKKYTRKKNVTEVVSQIKIERLDDDELNNFCRVCLKPGNIPIFSENDSLCENINIFSGLDIQEDDMYPKHLCQPCYELLQGAILLRKTAQESDIILRRSPEVNYDVQEDEWNMDNDDTSYERKVKKKTKPKKKYNCKRCKIVVNSFQDYQEHILSEEHENMRQICHICHKSYTSAYFKKHMALHKAELHYVCDICGKKFIVQTHFSRHRLTHFYELPFKCSLCPYKGRFSESLKMHMRTHTGERPYPCTNCPARFVNKSNLNKHLLTHKDEHDFKCDICGRGFYVKRDLDVHIRVEHNGIKDHVCNICHKAFGYRKQMMKHQLKVHKREKLRSGRMPIYLQVESKKQKGENIPLG